MAAEESHYPAESTSTSPSALALAYRLDATDVLLLRSIPFRASVSLNELKRKLRLTHGCAVGKLRKLVRLGLVTSYNGSPLLDNLQRRVARGAPLTKERKASRRRVADNLRRLKQKNKETARRCT